MIFPQCSNIIWVGVREWDGNFMKIYRCWALFQKLHLLYIVHKWTLNGIQFWRFTCFSNPFITSTEKLADFIGNWEICDSVNAILSPYLIPWISLCIRNLWWKHHNRFFFLGKFRIVFQTVYQKRCFIGLQMNCHIFTTLCNGLIESFK